MADNVENKVEGTEEAAAPAKKEKKSVDVNAIMGNVKSISTKAMGSAAKIYAQDLKKGFMIAELVPAVMAILGVAMGANIIAFLLMLILAALNYAGLEAIKKAVLPAEEEAPAAE